MLSCTNLGYAKPSGPLDKPGDFLDSLMTDPMNYRVKFNLPYRKNELFVGRQEIFTQLNAIIFGNRDKQTAVLYGIGGIGKTQIAQHYVHTENVNFSTVLWLNAATVDSIRESFLQIAQHLINHYVELVALSRPPYGRVAEVLGLKRMVDDEGRVQNNTQAVDSVANAVLAWLNLPSNNGWLVIYDNYDDPESFAIGKYMPFSHAGKIIITSRRHDCARLGQGIEVGKLSGQESVRLLLQSCQIFSSISEEEGE